MDISMVVKIQKRKENKTMGIFFNEDRKVLVGKYKGIYVWSYGCMIGNNWYGEYYITIPKGKSKRRMKVKDSVRNNIEEVRKYIDENIEKLK